MTKLLEDKTAQESIRESRAALRGMNTHVAAILQHNEVLAQIVDKNAKELRALADKIGEIVVLQYNVRSNADVPVSLKKEIHRIANTLLEGAAK